MIVASGTEMNEPELASALIGIALSAQSLAIICVMPTGGTVRYAGGEMKLRWQLLLWALFSFTVAFQAVSMRR